MEPNMGKADRVIRSILAVLVVILFFRGIVTGVLGLVLIVLATVFAATSFLSCCPIHSATRFSARTSK
ncbi:MAG: DUF2892 domain-containing protein [Flavobacteriales bacterium]